MSYHAHDKEDKDTIQLVMVHQTTYSQHQLSDHHTITWLQSPQNSASLIQPPNPVLEPLLQPALAPTDQSSGLLKHGAQVGVLQLCEDPD